MKARSGGPGRYEDIETWWPRALALGARPEPAMIVASMLLACSSTGAEITLTDLDDPSGYLEESWSADAAFWSWSSSESELWVLSESTATLTLLGDFHIEPLSLTTATTECGDLQDWIDVGTALVDQLEDGAAVADHCDALTTFFDDLDALDDGGTEHVALNAYIEDLVGGTPGTGSWSEPDVTGVLVWSDGEPADAGAAWDTDGCTFTYTEPANETQLWTFPELSLTIDEADSSVVGSLDAARRGDDGGTGSLSATFEAEFCEYTGGAVVLTGP